MNVMVAWGDKVSRRGGGEGVIPFVGRRSERAQILLTMHNVAMVDTSRKKHIHYVGDESSGKTCLIGEIGKWLKEAERTDFIDVDLSDPYCYDPAIKLRYLRDLASESLKDIDLSAFDFLFLLYDYGHRSSTMCGGGLKGSKFSPKDVLEEGILDGLKQSATLTIEELKKAGFTIALSGTGAGAGGAYAAHAAQAANVLAASLVTGAATIGAVSSLFLGKALLDGAFSRARREKVFKEHPELAKLVTGAPGGRPPRAEDMIALLPKLLASAINKAQEARGAIVCISLDPAEEMKSRDPDHGIGSVVGVLVSLLGGLRRAVLITTSRSSWTTWSASKHAKAVSHPDPAVCPLPGLSLSDVKDWLEAKGIPPEATLARLFSRGGDMIAPLDFVSWWNERGDELGASAVS